MASAFVFPGGGAEPGEDARTAAARELFEEAGILLAKDDTNDAETLELPSLAALRKRIQDGANSVNALARAGLAWSTDVLVPWAHWITPSLESAALPSADGRERPRFSARFFVCELPPGQQPQFDDIETVEQAWVRPIDALAHAKQPALPPPQVRICWELAECATIDEVMVAGRAREDEPHPILPRVRTTGDGPCLLLPWDPEYAEGGSGDSAPMAYRPRWARGPSRFVMEDAAWRHVAAPGSTTPG